MDVFGGAPAHDLSRFCSRGRRRHPREGVSGTIDIQQEWTGFSGEIGLRSVNRPAIHGHQGTCGAGQFDGLVQINLGHIIVGNIAAPRAVCIVMGKQFAIMTASDAGQWAVFRRDVIEIDAQRNRTVIRMRPG